MKEYKLIYQSVNKKTNSKNKEIQGFSYMIGELFLILEPVIHSIMNKIKVYGTYI